MIKYRTHIFLMALLVLAAAQGAQGQSLFSLNYIGERSFRGSARDAALAYSSLALPDTAGALTMNPATTASLTRVTLGLGQRFMFSSSTYGDYKVSRNNYQLPAIVVAFPVIRNLVFNFGYRTRFEGKVDFSIPAEVEGPGYAWDGSAVEEYSHNGSLYSVPLGMAWKLNDWISLEGEVHLERGTIKDKVTENLQNSDYTVTNSEIDRSYSATSFGFYLLARVHSRLRLAGSYDAGIDYSVSEDIRYSLSSLNRKNSYNLSVPPAYGVSLAGGISSRWWMTAGLFLRDAPGTAGFEQFAGALGEDRMISVGLERSRGEGNLPFFSRIPLRLGYYQNNWHMEIPSGEPVISRFFTIGSGIMLPGGPGSVDFAFEFGRIGSESSNGLEESVMRLNISINLSEKWKRREQRRH